MSLLLVNASKSCKEDKKVRPWLSVTSAGSPDRDMSHRSAGSDGAAVGSPHIKREEMAHGRHMSDFQHVDAELNELEKTELEEDPERKCCGTKAWLYPELPWGAPPEWDKAYMQGATFLAIWEVLTFVCCLYVAVSVPYNVTFVTKQQNISIQNGLEIRDDCVFKHLMDLAPGKFYMSLMDLFVDVVFYVDIFFNFHTAVWELSRDGSPHWVLIDNLPQVRSRYMRGGLFTDLIGQIPWQYSDCFLVDRPEVKILRLFRLLKLLRLHRLKRMIKAMYRKFPEMELVITGFELVKNIYIYI